MSADRAIESMKQTKAQYSRGPRNYFDKYGTYVVEVIATKSVIGFRGLTDIAELKILEAEPLQHPDAAGAEPHKVGEETTYQENKCDPGAASTARFKGCVATAMGATDAELDSVIPGIIGESAKNIQAATFLRMKAVVYPKYLPPDPKKNLPGKTIAAQKWATLPLTPEQLADANARRVALGLPTFAEAIKQAKAAGK